MQFEMMVDGPPARRTANRPKAHLPCFMNNIAGLIENAMLAPGVESPAK
jgi:hypothetical protein